jgi:hypothetical protein
VTVSARHVFSGALWTRPACRRRCMPRVTRMAAKRDIVVYPFNDHEGGLSHRRLTQINRLNDLIGFQNAG